MTGHPAIHFKMSVRLGEFSVFIICKLMVGVEAGSREKIRKVTLLRKHLRKQADFQCATPCKKTYNNEPQASVLCCFCIPFYLIYEGVQLDSLPFEHSLAVLLELSYVIGCCHAEPITAKLSRAKVKVAHESSELHLNFIYPFNLIFYKFYHRGTL